MKRLIISHFLPLTPEPYMKNDIFLGPWCFFDQKGQNLIDFNAYQTLPSPWVSPDEYQIAGTYINSLCDRLLAALTQYLNTIHGTNHAEQFWTIIARQWLHEWLVFSYDIHERLSRTSEYDCLTARVLSEFPISVKDYYEFAVKRGTSAYNALFISDIIRNSTAFPWIEFKELPFPHEEYGTQLQPEDVLAPLKERYEQQPVVRISNFLRDRSRCFLGRVTGMMAEHEIFLYLNVDPLSLFRSKSYEKSVAYADKDLVENTPIPFEPQNTFEEMAGRLIKKHLPNKLLTYEKYTFRRKILAVSFHHFRLGNEYFYAHLREQGGLWYGAQHGCGYGCYLHPDLKREYAITDRFVTWGWTETDNEPDMFDPLPSPFLTYRPKSQKEDRSDLVFATGALNSPYPYMMVNNELNIQNTSQIIANRHTFVENLTSPIYANCLYRPKVNLGGNLLDDVGLIKSKFPDIRICTTLDKGFVDVVEKAKLYVSDTFYSSVSLQAMAMDLPSILFMDPDSGYHTTRFRKSLKKLEEVGIVHRTPQAAALYINTIWDDVQGWWNEKTRQDTVKLFCQQWAYRKDDWYKDWKQYLNQEIKKLNRKQ